MKRRWSKLANFHQHAEFFFSNKSWNESRSKYIKNMILDRLLDLYRFLHIYLTFRCLISDILNEVLPRQVLPLLVRLHLLPINRIHQMFSPIYKFFLQNWVCLFILHSLQNSSWKDIEKKSTFDDFLIEFWRCKG